MLYSAEEDEIIVSAGLSHSSSSVIYWSLDSSGNCRQISNEWMEFTGVKIDRALNEGRLLSINPHDFPNYMGQYYRAIEKRLPFKIEYRLKDRTGNYQWMQDVGTPFYNIDNEFAGYAGTTLNIHVEKINKLSNESSSNAYNDLRENSTIGIFYLDSESRIIWANEEMGKMLDYSTGELKGNKLSAFIEDKTLISELDNKKLLRNNYKNLLWKIRCRNGLVRYFNICTSVYKEKGKITYIRCFANDVSEYKFSEEVIKERNKTLQILNSIGNTISAKLDLKVLVKAVTDAATGISGAEFGVFFYNSDSNSPLLQYEAVSGSPLGGFSTYPVPGSVDFSLFKNNSIIRINNLQKESRHKNLYTGIPEGLPVKSYMAIPITSRTGEVLGGIFLGHSEAGIFTDLTETFVSGIASQASIAIDNAKLFEAKREGEERFRILAESIPLMIFTAQPNGSLDYCNKRWQEYTGLTPEQTLGMGWVQSIHKKDLLKSLKLWKESIEANTVYEIEYRLKRYNDNTYRWHLVRAIPINDEFGNIIKWFGTCTDIEDQKRQHQKKDDFISIAGHELKTPLTSIKAYVQLLERMLSESENTIAKSYLKKINTYSDRLNHLIADLLDVSRIQSGKMLFNMHELDVNDLVKETVESIQPTTSTHKIVVSGTGGKILGDKARLEQVLINFLTNAIKYSPGCADVNVDVEQDTAHLKISVSDYGIGIPNEKLNKVFERFYRVESAAHKFTGLGIGLYISSEIIKRHNGRVWVESEEGKGAKFSFVIPVTHNSL